jgi:hypothetical protein
MHTKILSGTLKGRNTDLVVDGGLILKWILKESAVVCKLNLYDL